MRKTGKILKRLEKATVEMLESDKFDLTIINDDLEIAQKQLKEAVHYFLRYGN